MRVKKRNVSIRHPGPSPHFTLKMMPTPEVIYFLLKLVVTNKKHALLICNGDPIIRAVRGQKVVWEEE